jgi:hypothetical protein
MGRLFAILAIVGLLLSPAAAAAAAQRCAHEHGARAMVMDVAHASPTSAGADHECCDDAGEATDHDMQACAQDCAIMCAVNAALPAATPIGVVKVGAFKAAPTPASGVHPFAPPGLKRPPRTIA